MGFFPHRLINELCLTSFAMRGYNCPPSNVIGHDCSEVLTNDVKTKVDTGSAPGGGKDVLFVYIKHIGLNPNQRKCASHLVDKLPMRSSVPAIQEAGSSEDKRAYTE
jgi:hypothetical protein